MRKKYRANGAVGALLDEYQRSINELKDVVSGLTESELTTIVDNMTADEDCRSIQTVLSHVVVGGYNYVVETRKSLGEDVLPFSRELLYSISEYATALDNMFAYNEKFFDDYPDIKLEQYNCSEKFEARWGQMYDVEQMYEHAIVHVLGHRRQIERFKYELAKTNAR